MSKEGENVFEVKYNKIIDAMCEEYRYLYENEGDRNEPLAIFLEEHLGHLAEEIRDEIDDDAASLERQDRDHFNNTRFGR